MSIGQLTFDIEGLSLTAEDKEILQHPDIGGLILFSRNYESPEQVIELVTSIRSIKPNLLISVDQEGGRVQRFKKGFSELPKLRLLGDLYDKNPDQLAKVQQYAENLGQLMAIEIQSVGVDLSFAPVVDCDKGISLVIGDRAFHHDPKMIASLAAAYINGMHKGGMSATLKHFPGHGGVVADSHVDLPVDERAPDEIMADMVPFKSLIKNNIKGVDALMPAHVIYQQIDPNPVGFSTFWLQEVLRDKIGFTGAIISDDLSMEGAKVVGDMQARVEASLEAGCDMVLVCNSRDALITVLDKVTIADNPQSQQRISKLIKQPSQNYQQLRQEAVWQQCTQQMTEFLTKVEGCKVA